VVAVTNDTIKIGTGSDETWPVTPDDDDLSRTIRDQATFGRFTILDVLGAGGMGVVLSAYDPQLDRKVAIKVLRTRGLHGERYAREAERLLREARSMAQLSHPHVVTVYEAGTIDGRVFVAMEYISGQTLRSWLAERKHRVDEIIDVLVKAGRGLAAGHHAGLIHRDFKPDNVLIGHDGRVRVIDFGLARPEGPTDYIEPALFGTPLYMAPEQHDNRELDARTDQFSFCVALYEALYGHPPFPTQSYPLLVHAVISGDVIAPEPDPQIPSRVVDAVMRGLRANPHERFQVIDDLLAELQPVARDRRGLVVLWMAGVAMVAAITTLAVTRVADDGVRDDPRIADISLGITLVGLSETLEATGQPERAIPEAERGLELLSHGGDPVQLARARYALAKALWKSHRDLDRARELAEQARRGFAAGGIAASNGLRAVDGWLEATAGP
jgi:predicted Ser/Thr protein kinase